MHYNIYILLPCIKTTRHISPLLIHYSCSLSFFICIPSPSLRETVFYVSPCPSFILDFSLSLLSIHLFSSSLFSSTQSSSQLSFMELLHSALSLPRGFSPSFSHTPTSLFTHTHTHLYFYTIFFPCPVPLPPSL